MYNETYINTLRKSYLNDILNKRIPLPSINSKTCKDKQIYFVFQHYLLKKLANNEDKNRVLEFLMTYYKDLEQNPSLFVTSPLINNRVMDEIIRDKDLKDKIKAKRDSFYDGRLIPSLREKSRNNNLTSKEKELYYAILIHNIKNPKQHEVIEEEIDRIIDRATIAPDGSFKDTGIKNLSPMEIQFYTYYLTVFYNSKKFIPTFIGEAAANLNGFEHGEMIFLNTIGNASFSLADFTETVFHEARHVTQQVASKTEKTRRAIEMAQSCLFIKYLPEKGESYTCNYKYSSVELDAEQFGHYNAKLFFYMRNRKELAERVKQSKVEKYDKRYYYAYMLDSNKKPVSVDKFIVENFDQIMRNHPEEMENYPVLKELYTKDGRRKPLSEFLINKVHSFGEDNCYTNFINYGIAIGELDSIDLNNTSKEDKRDILKCLSGVYRNYILNIVFAHGTDNPSDNISKTQIVVTTNYALNQVTRIIEFVEKNFDKLMSAYKGEKLDHTNPMFNLIYDIRDHSLDKITNPVLLQSDKFKKKFETLKQRVDSLIEKYNKAYVDSRLNKVGLENLSKRINVEGIGNITVEDYIDNYLVPNMNSHQYVIINGQQLYIGDILNKLKSYVESDSDNKRK